jgi:putative ABC transport system permease protein
MQTRYILSALRKHRLATFLIALQIALAFAVLCNACFLVVQRIDATRIDSGVDEASLGAIRVTGFDPAASADLTARVLAALRRIPGLQGAGTINMAPFSDGASRAGVMLDAEEKHFGGVIDFYVGDAAARAVLGLTPIAGRLPTADEYTPVAQYTPADPPVLITRTLAQRFWPGQDPLGQRFWAMDNVFRVIGVVEHLAVTAPGGGEAEDPDWSVFVPAVAGPNLAGNYLLRGAPGEMARIMAAAHKAVQAAAPDAVLDPAQSRRLSELRAQYFRNSLIMAALLAGVIAALLGTTALGIVGLANFWVTQRAKQIGIRRALGATQGDILRYFQTENFLIVTLGIAAGALLAFGLSRVLMRMYELPPLPLWYLAPGEAALWLLGQLAVLVPALRATRVAPMAAIKAV